MSNYRFPRVERETFFTDLDFRSKFFLVAVITAISFVWESPILQLGMAVLILMACLFAGIKWNYLRTIFLIMLPFIIFMILSHGFFNIEQVKSLTGKAVLTPLLQIPAHWWIIGGGVMSVEGTLYGINVAFKSLTILLVMPFLLFSTDLNDMIISLVKMRVPYKLAFIFSATLRFFPLLAQEIRNIMDAQRLRGLELEKMNPFHRVSIYSKLAVPFILNSLMKSQQLDVVLQSKAFSGSSERTYLHETQMGRMDRWVIAGAACFFILAIAFYIFWGIGKFGGPV